LIKFHLFPSEFLAEKIRETHPTGDEETIEQVSKLSLGKAGLAIDLMDNPDKLAYFLKLYKDILYLLETDNVVDKFAYAAELSEDESKGKDFFGVLSHILRTRILENNSFEEKEKFIRMVATVQESAQMLKKNINAKLVLENLMLTK